MGTFTSSNTELLEKEQHRIQEPPRYACILHNDHFTTRDFVVHVLVSIFQMPTPEAERKMMEVHQQGRGRVGNYSFDIARTKAEQTQQLAKENEFPLKCSVEPV